MRTLPIALVLAASAVWAGCSTKVSLGDRVKPTSAVSTGSCTQNSDCLSGLCLGQACCSATSCGTDVTCRGTSCDATGACVYPNGSCGTPSCDSQTNQLTTSSCTQGTCTAGSAAACAGNLTCADATSCHGSCAQTSDCLTGFYCSAAGCQAQLGAGTACASNDSCATGICGAAGTGHCCTVGCASGLDAGCAATDCDDTGACVYPDATGCPCGKDTDCKDARICVDGACVFPASGVCFIQGQFIASDAFNAANGCQICSPTQNEADWVTTFSVGSSHPFPATIDGGYLYLKAMWPFASAVGGRTDSLFVADSRADDAHAWLLTMDGGLVLQSSFALPPGSFLEHLTTIDLDGDGFNDLLLQGTLGSIDAGYYESWSIFSVILGVDGGFVPGATYVTPNYLWDGGRVLSTTSVAGLATSDFNGDGQQSVVVTFLQSTYDQSTLGPYSTTRLELWTLDGDGGLAVAATQEFSDAGNPLPNYSGYTGTPLVGDLNEDGKADLLFWSTDPSSRAHTLTVFISDGGGKFAAIAEPAPQYPLGAAQPNGQLVVADFNGDTHLDVAVVNSDGSISVELGDGTGALGQPLSGPPQGWVSYPWLATSDFNGDGIPDLSVFTMACLNGECSAGLGILLGVGDGTFLPAAELARWSPAGGMGDTFGPIPLDTGNGRPDLAVTRPYMIDPFTTSFEVTILQNGCK